VIGSWVIATVDYIISIIVNIIIILLILLEVILSTLLCHYYVSSSAVHFSIFTIHYGHLPITKVIGWIVHLFISTNQGMVNAKRGSIKLWMPGN
jgi:hypothetical protein